MAIIDALGFKGIWKRRDKDDLLNRLHQARDMGLQYQALPPPAFSAPIALPKTHSEFRFWSDTVFVAEIIDHPGDYTSENNARNAVVMASLKVVAYMAEALGDAGPHLAYRGAVAFGEFEVDGDFIVGPAVDEAAEYASVADGAFVIVTPETERTLAYLGPIDPMLIPWDVPLKSGHVLKTRVLNPLTPLPTSELMRQATERVLSTFTGVEVQLKRQHTKQFLDFVCDRGPFTPPNAISKG